MADAASYHQLLLVEDSPSLATVYQEYLRAGPYQIRHAHCIADALRFANQAMPDGVLLDLRLPDGDGLSVLRELRGRDPDLPVVVMTAHGSVALAVEAMQAGASDFLVKPFAPERLTVTVANVMERAALRRQVAELAAEAVHSISPRKAGPFIAINCAAIPKDLIESEIFGHVRGAFTGAVADRIGAARAADGGTLFLDEICEMDLALQGKLLRFIQTGTFQPVGSGKTLQTDVRFVCATNRDPLEEVRAGRFREDLYYRLHVIPVPLPPLRDRGDDVLALAEAFLVKSAAEEGKRFQRFDTEARAMLMRHTWPGNVRELENAIRTAVVLHDGEVVSAAMLPATVREGGAKPAPAPAPPPREPEVIKPAPPPTPVEPRAVESTKRIRPLAETEREAIEEAVRLCGGNIAKAAAFLGISPSTLYRKQESWRRR